jgi:hypothetical protein
MAAPVTTSADMVALLQQQLGDIAALKTSLMVQQAAVIAAGAGPTYSISGPNGSESLDMIGYLRWLGDQVKSYLELERSILEQLQDLQPFMEKQRLYVGGSILGRW